MREHLPDKCLSIPLHNFYPLVFSKKNNRLYEIQKIYNKYYNVGSRIQHNGYSTEDILQFTTKEVILELRETFEMQ